MKRLTVTVLLFTFSLGAFANNKIQKGDYLFLSARLIDCSDAMRMIDYAKVSSNGDATFFKGLGKSKGVKINVIDKSAEVAEALLLKVYSKRFGYRPKSFSMNKVLASDERTQANLLLMLTQLKNSPCRFKFNLQKNEEKIASHFNKNERY